MATDDFVPGPRLSAVWNRIPTNPSIVVDAPPAAVSGRPPPVQQHLTTIRMLLLDTSAKLEQFNTSLESSTTSVATARREVVAARDLLHHEHEKVVDEMVNLTDRSQTRILSAIEEKTSPLSGLLRATDAICTKLDDLSRKHDAVDMMVRTQSAALHALQEQQANLLSTLSPLLPLVQALPPHIDGVKLEVKDLIRDSTASSRALIEDMRNALRADVHEMRAVRPESASVSIQTHASVASSRAPTPLAQSTHPTGVVPSSSQPPLPLPPTQSLLLSSGRARAADDTPQPNKRQRLRARAQSQASADGASTLQHSHLRAPISAAGSAGQPDARPSDITQFPSSMPAPSAPSSFISAPSTSSEAHTFATKKESNTMGGDLPRRLPAPPTPDVSRGVRPPATHTTARQPATSAELMQAQSGQRSGKPMHRSSSERASADAKPRARVPSATTPSHGYMRRAASGTARDGSNILSLAQGPAVLQSQGTFAPPPGPLTATQKDADPAPAHPSRQGESLDAGAAPTPPGSLPLMTVREARARVANQPTTDAAQDGQPERTVPAAGFVWWLGGDEDESMSGAEE